MTSTIAKGRMLLRMYADNAIDVYDEIQKTKYVKYSHRVNFAGLNSSVISIDDDVMDAIMLYVKNGDYAGLQLHQFLDKLYFNRF